MTTTLKVKVTYDWQGVADRVDLVALISSAYQPPARIQGAWAMFRCPFHEDHNPSLVVNIHTKKWKCYAGCHGSGEHWNNVYDWFEHFHHMDKRAAYAFLTTGSATGNAANLPHVDLSKAPSEKPKTPKRPLSWHKVRACAGRPEARLYFNGRGVTNESIDEYLLGYQVWERYKVRIDDQVLGRVPRPHFTIPHFLGDDLKSVKCRRDDAACRELLPAVDDSIFVPVLEYLTEKLKGQTPTEEQLIDAIFGGRFTQWEGEHKVSVFNERVLFHQLPSGEYMLRPIPYVLAVEAEIDAIYLRDALGRFGYPAVALKAVSGLDLKHLFSKVGRLYIVRDNDDPGEKLANAIKAAAGKGSIISPPVGKDCNDVPPATLRGWLASKGVFPMPRALI